MNQKGHLNKKGNTESKKGSQAYFISSDWVFNTCVIKCSTVHEANTATHES